MSRKRGVHMRKQLNRFVLAKSCVANTNYWHVSAARKVFTARVALCGTKCDVRCILAVRRTQYENRLSIYELGKRSHWPSHIALRRQATALSNRKSYTEICVKCHHKDYITAGFLLSNAKPSIRRLRRNVSEPFIHGQNYGLMEQVRIVISCPDGMTLRTAF